MNCYNGKWFGSVGEYKTPVYVPMEGDNTVYVADGKINKSCPNEIKQKILACYIPVEPNEAGEGAQIVDEVL